MVRGQGILENADTRDCRSMRMISWISKLGNGRLASNETGGCRRMEEAAK